MSSIELNGARAALELEQSLTLSVSRLFDARGLRPTLAAILVGEDPASARCVQAKGDACERVGVHWRRIVLPQSTSTEQLLAVIDRLNADPTVHGIVLQLPVPERIDVRTCLDRIATGKDVDGATARGIGNMALGKPAFGAATPAGIMHLLQRHGLGPAGRLAVVVGRSLRLGKPMSVMLLNANAIVVNCHSKTKDLPALIAQADIVVAAVDIPCFVQGDWIKDGAVVVDAGAHPSGVGDTRLSGHTARFAAWTPVPGGVGPMTVATLLAQTVEAFEFGGPRT